jgi:hypothetical protein
LKVDASYHPDGSGAAGNVLRDDKGKAIASKACLVDNMMGVATAEATALLRGLEFLEQIGCSSAYIESDTLELIHASNGDAEVWSIVARFGIGAAYHDPGSIDPERGQDRRVERHGSAQDHDPVC